MMLQDPRFEAFAGRVILGSLAVVIIFLVMAVALANPAKAAWNTCITPEMHATVMERMYPDAVEELHVKDEAAKRFMAWYNKGQFAYRIGWANEVIVYSKPRDQEVAVATFARGCISAFIYISAKEFYQRYKET